MRGAKNTVRRLAAAAMITGLALVVLASVAGADTNTGTGGDVGALAVTVTWDTTTQNGASGGSCDSFQSDPDLTPGPGQQAWLFILNQVDPNTGWSLSATFNPGGAVSGTIIKTENNNIHFQVLSQDNALLVSATATNSDNDATAGNLVVSHCEHGAEVTTTSSSTSTSTSTSTSSTSTSTSAPTSTSTSTSAPTSTSTSTSTSTPSSSVSPTSATNATTSTSGAITPGPTAEAATAAQGLPRTGSGTSLPLLFTGIGLILGGGGLLVASRRITS